MQESVRVATSERTGKPSELFSIWVATNIGILGLVYGAIIVSYQLSFVQSVLAAAVGACSFLLVGYLSLAGKVGGTTMFNLSRAVFGTRGNYIPTLCGWINLVGWMCVNVITGTLTLLALATTMGVAVTSTTTVVSLLVLSALIAVFGLFSQENLVRLQTFFTYVFGVLTLIVLAFILVRTDWAVLLAMPNGSWIGGFLPAVSIICAGTGISWAIAAADYSVYQNPNNSDRSIILATTMGGFIPLFILMTMGILMTSSVPDFLSAANPIEIIGKQLPSWMTVPYLLTALVGLIAPSVISLRSARVNLETLHIRVKDTVAIAIHVVIMLTLGAYVLFVSTGFLTMFQAFLGLIGIALAGWGSAFLVDFVMIRRHVGYEDRTIDGDAGGTSFNATGIIAWSVGVVVGLLFTSCPLFAGPFATGIFENNSLGMMLTFIVTAVIYAALSLRAGKAE